MGRWRGPALQKLLIDVQARRIDVIVVYKVDRLTRSLADFAKLVELFDEHDVSFVSVTQAFNTTTSMGRLTLNVLLSFAQFEREVTGERIRTRSPRLEGGGWGWGGGAPGARVAGRALASRRAYGGDGGLLFGRYLEAGSVVRPSSSSTLRAFGSRPASTAGAVGRGGAGPAGAHLQDPVEPDLCRPDRS